MALKLNKIICFFIIAIISVSSPLALASKSCCDVSSAKESQKPAKMKCHEAEQVSKSEKTKTSDSNEKNDKCNCNCGVCKVSFYNLPKIIKTSEKYSVKYSVLKPESIQKSFSFGIFTPPKIS